MAIFDFEYPEMFVVMILAIVFLYGWTHKIQKRSEFPTNWPLAGTLPAIFRNRHRIHDYATEVLTKSGGTLEFKGPWFCNRDMLVTSDPKNIHHIFSKNFSNYPKGPEFKKIFEILGDGPVNVDFELWELHRRTTLSFVTHVNFYCSLERTVWHKVEAGLLPVLDYFCNQRIEVDLEDIFQRFAFDSICKLVLDYDPCSLSKELPYIPCEKAFNDTIEALLHRHILPERIWKLQKWLKVGEERKHLQAWKAFDLFIYPHVDFKEEHGDHFNLLKDFRKAYEEMNGTPNSGDCTRRFLRDTVLGFMIAGRDTTSTCLTWLFWLLSANPLAEIKILEEIKNESLLQQGKKWRCFNVEESRKLVYIHGALCESLRLFPPVPLEHKSPIEPDILPSGHYLKRNTKVIVSFYSIGRTEMVWGKDCLEFQPERWISPCGGRIKHEPSYKFPAFNSGPRSCLGKEMSFIQMKMIAAAVIYHYNIQLVEGHPAVSPRDSIILQTKHGLRVRLTKRNV